MCHQPNIDKIHLNAKDPFEAKYQLLINKTESLCLNHCNDPKVFIEYWTLYIITFWAQSFRKNVKSNHMTWQMN